MPPRLVLRADALLDLVLGALLLLAPWDALYRALDLPRAKPEIFTQVAGVAIIVLGYLLWLAPRDDNLTQAIAAAKALANTLAVVVVAAWLLFGDLGIATRGTAVLGVVGALFAVFALAEGRIAARRIAILLPRD